MTNDILKALGDMQRRLNNLIRVGSICEVKGTKLRVKLGGNTTAWLPWLTHRAGDCKTWWQPSVGEQVIVFSPSGELNNGVVLPAIYTQNAPAEDANKHLTTYPDGTEIEYDYNASKLKINCVGTVEIKATDVKIEAPNTTCKGNLMVMGGLTYMQGMTGKNTSGGSSAVIDGSLSATGDIKAGNISLESHTHTGDNGGNTSPPR
jgi:phage baseplate assembly protein V